MVYISFFCDPSFIANIILSRVIALPSVKYSGRVETDVFESLLGLGKPDCRENNN